MFEVIWSLAAFIVTLGVLVTFHEFGHFWVARRCGVHVHTFSVGFGKPLWQRKGRDGTVYQVALIPLGGYVKMLDSRMETVAPEDYPRSFNAQSVGKRMAIVAAGPAANFILAIAVLWLMLMLGVPSVKPIIGEVREGSIATAAAVPTAHEIIKVGEQRTLDWSQVNMALVSYIGNSSVTLTLKDVETDQQLTRTLDLSAWEFNEQQATFVSLGVLPYQPQVLSEVAYLVPDSPAAQAGLQIGDKIVGFNGTLTSDWSRIRAFIGANAGQQVSFLLERDGEQLSRDVLLGSREVGTDTVGFLGIETRAEPYPEAYRFNQQYGVLAAAWEGTVRTWDLMVLSVKMIGKLLTGDVSVKNLSGPVSIAEGAGTSASYGVVYFLGFLALISVNLGIINLLPLPVLDGGHLVFFAIEWIRGKPVSERIQDVSYRVGGALVFALMIIAISNDISRFLL